MQTLRDNAVQDLSKGFLAFTNGAPCFAIKGVSVVEGSADTVAVGLVAFDPTSRNEDEIEIAANDAELMLTGLPVKLGDADYAMTAVTFAMLFALEHVINRTLSGTLEYSTSYSVINGNFVKACVTLSFPRC